MKKFISILFLFCIPIFAFGQNKSFKGFYQTKFFNFLGDVKVIEGEFEVKENNAIAGTVKLGNDSKILQGTVDSKGKFEARTQPENGATTIVKGELPVNGKEGKVSFIQRVEQKGNGGKSVSESGINGFIKSISPPVELKDVGIVDNGKTLLWFQHSNPLFGKEWADSPASVEIKNTADQTAIEVTMKLKTDSMERRFRFRMLRRQPEQKIWKWEDLSISSYAESRKTADGKEDLNFFMGSQGNVTGGQIEIAGENENEIIFKITNLRIKKLSQEDSVQIDGFIHAAKIK